MEDQRDVKIWNCGYELRFELWETEGNFKNKNFFFGGGCHKEDSPPKYTNIGVQTQGRGIV